MSRHHPQVPSPSYGSVRELQPESCSSTGVLDLHGHTSWIRRVVPLSNGSRLATCSNDRTVRIFSTSTGSCIHELSGHNNDVYGLAALGGDVLASSDIRGGLRIWDAAVGELLYEIVLPGSARVAALSATTFLASGGVDLFLFSHADGDAVQLLHTVAGVHEGVITSIAVNGLRFGIASDDGTASVWEIADACKVRKLACLTGHTRYVLSISLGLQQIATGSADGTVRLYRADNFALVRVIDNKNGAWVWSVCVFGGNFVLYSATDGTARVVTINDGNSAVRVDVPYDARDAVILEDGRIAIACYNFVALRPTPAVIAKAYNSSCDGDVEKGNKERSLND